MTKLRTYRLFPLALGYGRGANSSKDVSLPAMFCIVCLFCVAAAIAAPAQSVYFTTLASFNGTNGADPEAPVIQGADGNLYGTTDYGGAHYCGVTPCGTVYKITLAGTLTSLYSFCSQPGCADGIFPIAGLMQANDGSLYGTTSEGGVDFDGNSFGTVFKITPQGTLTTLYSFCASGPPCTDGDQPVAGLVQANDGNLYGTTLAGGLVNGGNGGSGTVFRVTPAGELTTLYDFCSQPNCADGGGLRAGLVQATDGNFYGTTMGGGHDCGENVNDSTGCGTVFKITPGGILTILHSFDGTDGVQLRASLVQATDGNLYGTTYEGGANYNNYCPHGCGTVFKITPGGTLTTLYSFCGQSGCPDGTRPCASLVQASDGNFYGTTCGGGNSDYGTIFGTIFKITSSGTLSTLYRFCSAGYPCPDGAGPYGGLVQASDGNFYGTTAGCGAYGYGAVYRLGIVHNCATCRR